MSFRHTDTGSWVFFFQDAERHKQVRFAKLLMQTASSLTTGGVLHPLFFRKLQMNSVNLTGNGSRGTLQILFSHSAGWNMMFLSYTVPCAVDGSPIWSPQKISKCFNKPCQSGCPKKEHSCKCLDEVVYWFRSLEIIRHQHLTNAHRLFVFHAECTYPKVVQPGKSPSKWGYCISRLFESLEASMASFHDFFFAIGVYISTTIPFLG